MVIKSSSDHFLYYLPNLKTKLQFVLLIVITEQVKTVESHH